MEMLSSLLHIILHLDVYLINWVNNYGALTYVFLFIIIFCETGLVIFPFLPGDSLLFAAGSIAAQSQGQFSFSALFVILTLASILGNKVNYLIGRKGGVILFYNRHYQLINLKHLAMTHAFYARHGGKTLILARFVPIVRTFAPFVAGMGKMAITRFSFYNMVSAILWIGSLLSLGYFFGNLPIVKANFTLVIYTIILISLLPAAVAFIKSALCGRKSEETSAKIQ